MDNRIIERLRTQARRPSTPGDLLADLLECNNISATKAAKLVGVTPASLTRLINGQHRLTIDMAQRLGRLFDNGPAVWLKFQQGVDMWDAFHMDATPYENIAPLEDREPERLAA